MSQLVMLFYRSNPEETMELVDSILEKKINELLNENVEGIVLSGGAPRIGLKGELGNCAEYLEKANFPILGICAGHQFMARFFGGNAEPSKIPEFGKIELKKEFVFSQYSLRS